MLRKVLLLDHLSGGNIFETGSESFGRVSVLHRRKKYEMTYRSHYWRKTKEQLYYTWYVFWHGVIRNKGHHSNWRKK
jgi:hypothetical protein